MHVLYGYRSNAQNESLNKSFSEQKVEKTILPGIVFFRGDKGQLFFIISFRLVRRVPGSYPSHWPNKTFWSRQRRNKERTKIRQKISFVKNRSPDHNGRHLVSYSIFLSHFSNFESLILVDFSAFQELISKFLELDGVGIHLSYGEYEWTKK